MNPRIAQIRHAKSAQAQSSMSSQGRSSQSNGNGKSQPAEINVGDSERQWSMIGGTALAVYGLMRGSISGLLLATIGGALIYRGHTGHCDLYQSLNYSTAEHDEEEHSGSEQHGAMQA